MLKNKALLRFFTARGGHLCAEVVVGALERRDAKRALKKGYIPHTAGSGPTPFEKNGERRQNCKREKKAALTTELIQGRKSRRVSLDETCQQRCDARRQRSIQSGYFTARGPGVSK